MEQIVKVVVDLQYPQEFWCATEIARSARQADDHANAHLQVKMVALRWPESVQRLRSYGIHKNLGV